MMPYRCFYPYSSTTRTQPFSKQTLHGEVVVYATLEHECPRPKRAIAL